MNFSTQLAIFAKTSRKTKAFLFGPLDTVHRFCWYTAFLASTAERISSKLILEFEKITALFLSLSFAAAYIQRSLLRAQSASTLIVE